MEEKRRYLGYYEGMNMGDWKNAMAKNRIGRVFIATLALIIISTTVSFASDVVINTEEVKTEGEGYYGNLLRVTVSVPDNESIANTINQQIEETLFADQKDILDEMQQLSQEVVVDHIPFGVDSMLQDSYIGDHILSINLYVMRSSGGPHPWHVFKSATFDLDTGTMLHLSDLFSTPDPWAGLTQSFYQSISAIPYVNEKFMTEDLMRFTKEEMEIFKNENPVSGWVITDEGLVFYYPAGGKTMYAAGDGIIPVSFNQLQSIGMKEGYLPAVAPSETHEYRVVISDASWQQANTEAQQMGGHLATITSPEEQSQIEQCLATYPGLRAVWVGSNFQSANNAFGWITGEPMTYTYWGPGEPNNETGDEHYLDMYPKNGSWVWNDVPNDISMFYSGNMGYVVEIEG